MATHAPFARSSVSRGVWVLAGVYSVASLVHFAHNAEYIAFYPNMPESLSRETVYLAWLAVTSVGIAGVAASVVGWRLASVLLLALYGALGFDGLGHYALALCSEHSLAANASIWFEVIAGGALVAASAWSLTPRERGKFPLQAVDRGPR